MPESGAMQVFHSNLGHASRSPGVINGHLCVSPLYNFLPNGAAIREKWGANLRLTMHTPAYDFNRLEFSGFASCRLRLSSAIVYSVCHV